MSSSFFHFTLLLILSSILFIQHSQPANATYLLPIVKDAKKPQYYTSFLFGTPAFRVYLSIDLSNPWSWFTCHLVGFNDSSYQPVPNSKTYRPIPCVNATCTSYGSQFCYDCNYATCAAAKGQTCGSENYGPYYYTHDVSGREVAPLLVDVISVYKANGPRQQSSAQLPNFPFSCAYYSELKGLSTYTKGVLSLARKDASIHGLISKTFKVPHKFALCLPSSSSTGINGAMYFGGGPYSLPPSKLDFAQTLVTTALVVNPVDIGTTFYRGNASVDYFINVKSILVGGAPIKLNSTLLSIDKNGIGGTKLSTIFPYTILHTQIYNALVEAFISKAASMNITRVAPVSSFGACFSSQNIVGSKTGPNVPVIDLVLLDGKSTWRIYGANSMIKVSNDVRCLAFMDGGVTPKTSVVIGGKQMEDNLIEFDLESSKLGVTSSLLSYGTSCSQFKGI